MTIGKTYGTKPKRGKRMLPGKPGRVFARKQEDMERIREYRRVLGETESRVRLAVGEDGACHLPSCEAIEGIGPYVAATMTDVRNGAHPLGGCCADAAEIEAASRRARNPRLLALETALLRSNERLVRAAVPRFIATHADCRETHGGMDREDLLQEGALAWVESLRSYDPDKGGLSGYTVRAVRFRTLRAYNNGCRTVRLPVCTQYERLQIEKAENEHCSLHGESPSDEWLADRLECSVSRIRTLRKFGRHGTSFDAKASDTARPLYDSFPDPSVQEPDALIDGQAQENAARQAIEVLSDRERIIIEARCLRPHKERATLEELRTRLGISHERVRQIQYEALRKMRERLESEGVTRESLHFG